MFPWQAFIANNKQETDCKHRSKTKYSVQNTTLLQDNLDKTVKNEYEWKNPLKTIQVYIPQDKPDAADDYSLEAGYIWAACVKNVGGGGCRGGVNYQLSYRWTSNGCHSNNRVGCKDHIRWLCWWKGASYLMKHSPSKFWRQALLMLGYILQLRCVLQAEIASSISILFCCLFWQTWYISELLFFASLLGTSIRPLFSQITVIPLWMH